MKVHRWEDIKRKRFTPEQIEEIRRQAQDDILELNLQAVRKLVGKTQSELAEAAQMAQGDLSRAERRDDHLVSTLRRYIEALGGEVEVIARFGKRKVRLIGV
jgi:predicted transcriptional regulator